MSAEIINLRQFRKQKARAEKDVQANENRAKYGLTKAEREKARLELDLAQKRLDQVKRGESVGEDGERDGTLDPGNVS